MNFYTIVVFFLLFIGCSLPPNSASESLIPTDQCCSEIGARGECFQELVPGCASNSAPLFKENFLRPDDCCEIWGRNGFCYKEKIKGCSSNTKR